MNTMPYSFQRHLEVSCFRDTFSKVNNLFQHGTPARLAFLSLFLLGDIARYANCPNDAPIRVFDRHLRGGEPARLPICSWIKFDPIADWLLGFDDLLFLFYELLCCCARLKIQVGFPDGVFGVV